MLSNDDSKYNETNNNNNNSNVDLGDDLTANLIH